MGRIMARIANRFDRAHFYCEAGLTGYGLYRFFARITSTASDQSSPHDPTQIFSPAFQRISHFSLVTGPIGHPSYAPAVTARVVQDRFYDMRQDA